ncbi:MAG: DUF4340 domain-containing protein, partial [Bdellovibrionales bacterium]|nr:DUF4340 domain-containing protein [Bdellovibrionales bacterium]
MKLKRLLILCSLLSLFGGYIYYFEIYKEQQSAQSEFESKLVVKFPIDKIQKISFVNSYDQFTLSKIDGAWSLQKPIVDYADKFVVEKLLEFISQQTVFQDFTKDVKDESQFGFSQKNNWIEIFNDKDQMIKISISDLVGLQGATYLRIDEDKTMTYALAAPEWRGEFDRTLLYYRDKFVFREDMNLLTKIEKWMNGKKLYTVSNKGDETWYWEDGRMVLIDKEKVYDIIQELVQATATDFLNYEELDAKRLKHFGLDKKLPLFKLYLNDNNFIEFKFSNTDRQKTYIIYKNRVYELFNNALSFLSWNLDDYKNRSRPFQVNLDDINELVYISGDKTESFSKGEKAWSSSFPGNRFLRIFKEQKAKKFLPDMLPPVL